MRTVTGLKLAKQKIKKQKIKHKRIFYFSQPQPEI
jgi:hypothetical protein